ncbi:MAG: class I SAM-dependent methyltransferase [Spirochaetia bacterium]|nr:class I SAM-dependent methyltransferase [Spirochaetia bacterium]
MKHSNISLNSFSRYLSRVWAQGKLNHIEGFLPEKSTILDIGSGKGAVSFALREKRYHVTSLDVKDKSLDPSLAPTLYDGIQIPFPDKHFDCGLLLTVLHHTPDPEAILKETSRVCRKIIIIEDVYSNCLQKYLTFFIDSLFNMEFFGHPHSNKTDAQWRSTFKHIGLSLEEARGRKLLLFFRQYAYILNIRGFENEAPGNSTN